MTDDSKTAPAPLRRRRARGPKLSPLERKRLAQAAAAARWGKPAVEQPAPADHPLAALEPADAVLAAAVKVFATRGYDRATLQEVAAEAGVGLPSIFRLHATKRDLYSRACRELIDRQMHHHRALMQRNGTPAEKIYALALSLADTHLQPHLIRLAHWEMLAPDSRLAGLSASAYWASWFDDYFATAGGLPIAGGDPRQRLLALIATILGLAEMSAMQGSLPALAPMADVEGIARFSLANQYPDVDWPAVRPQVRFEPFRLVGRRP